MRAHLGAHRRRQRRGGAQRVPPIVLLRAHLHHRRHPPHQRAQLQRRRTGRDPGHKGHARGILAQPPRRSRIGARALPTGAGEVLAHPRIEHHHLDARGALQRQRNVPAVDAGGFEHHARVPAALRQPAAHRAMPRRRVGHTPHRHRLIRRRALYIDPARTHIDSHHPHRGARRHLHLACARVVFRSPDPAHIAHRPCVCRLSGLGYSTALAIKGGGPLFRTSSLA